MDSEFSRLSELAARINGASDAAKLKLEAFEERLRDTRIGVAVHAGLEGEFGFEKLGDEWRITFHDSIRGVMPVINAPRGTRLSAVLALPDLLKAITRKAEYLAKLAEGI